MEDIPIELRKIGKRLDGKYERQAEEQPSKQRLGTPVAFHNII